MDLEEDQSSSKPQTPTVPDVPLEQARQLASRLSTILTKNGQSSTTIRTTERCSGPVTKHNSIRFHQERARFKITARKSTGLVLMSKANPPQMKPIDKPTQPLQERPKEQHKMPPPKEQPKSQPEPTKSKEFILTSNNMRTQGHEPNKLIEVIVECPHRDTIGMRIDRDTPAKVLHRMLRDKLSIPNDKDFSIVYPQHTVIEPDDRTLWANGLRNKPNHIQIIPGNVQRGDQLVYAYKGRGPNVNGTYEPQVSK